MNKLLSKVWTLNTQFPRVFRVIGLAMVLGALALAGGAPSDWGGCGCP